MACIRVNICDMTYDGAAETNPLYITALYISAPFSLPPPLDGQRLLRAPIDILAIALFAHAAIYLAMSGSRVREQSSPSSPPPRCIALSVAALSSEQMQPTRSLKHFFFYFILGIIASCLCCVTFNNAFDNLWKS